MSVLTLTSSWRNDMYSAILKGSLLREVPEARIIDISQTVPMHTNGIRSAAYLVKNSYPFFPEKTVHLISIASEKREDRDFLAISHKNQYFLLLDNGICGLLFEEDVPTEIYKIEKFTDDSSPNYPSLSVLLPAAIHIFKGLPLSELGAKTTLCESQLQPSYPIIHPDKIIGKPIHFNVFGNLVTNIRRENFEMLSTRFSKFDIYVASRDQKISKINRYFNESKPGHLLALFNQFGYLEIAIFNGSVQNILSLTEDTSISIIFSE